MGKNFKRCNAFFIAVYIMLCSIPALAVNVATYSELQSAISGSDSEIVITADINFSSSLTVNRTVTIKGDGVAVRTLDANNSSRHFNITGGTVIVEGLKFINGFTNAGDGGGSIIISSSNPSKLKNVIFESNSSGLGGAISYSYNSAVENLHEIDSCSFYENTSTGRGGAVHLKNADILITRSVFHSNSATEGGSFFSDGSDMQIDIDLSVFINNEATSNRGGAIFNFSSDINTRLSIDKSYFYGNKSHYKGGALYSTSNGDFWVKNSTFTKNEAKNDKGGAIARAGQANAGYKAILYHCTLVDNTASAGGGALLADANFKLKHTIIYNNGNSQCTGNNDVFESEGWNIVTNGCNGFSSNGALGDMNVNPDIIEDQDPPYDHKAPVMGASIDPNYQEPTRYFPLKFGGNAFDAGDTDAGNYIGETDQVFQPRFDNIAVDIGAVEFSGLNSNPETESQKDTIDENSTLEFIKDNFPFTDVDTQFDDYFDSLKITSAVTDGKLVYKGNDVASLITIPADSIVDLDFVPDPGEFSMVVPYATFEFVVMDRLGAESNTATYEIYVRSLLDPPEVRDTSFTINEDSYFQFHLDSLAYSDLDGNGIDSVILNSVSLNTGGDFCIDSNANNQCDGGESRTIPQRLSVAEFATLIYEPADDGAGSPYVVFEYYVKDGIGNIPLTNANFTLNVLPLGDSPTTSNTFITIDEDATYTFAGSDFPFSDPDAGDALTSVRIVNTVGVGTFQLNSTTINDNQVINVGDLTNVTFTPLQNAFGAPYTIFTFRVLDSDGNESNTATFTINVTGNPNDDAPTTTNNSITINEDVTYTFGGSDFPFSDPDEALGDALTSVRIVTTAGIGTFQLNLTAINDNQVINVGDLTNVTFTPVQNAFGSPYTTFTFRVIDSDGNESNTATFTINVTGNSNDDSPSTSNSSITIEEDEVYTFVVSDFPFTDPDQSLGDTLTAVEITTDVGEGSLRSGATVISAVDTIMVSDFNTFTYTPGANEFGTPYTSFTFKVLDKNLNISNSATFTINVNSNSNDDSPTTSSKAITINEDETYTFLDTDFAFNDPDEVLGDSLTAIVITRVVGKGSFIFDGNTISVGDTISVDDLSKWTYTPVENETGSPYTSFGFQVLDKNSNASNEGSITIYVLPDNTDDSPSTSNSSITILEDSVHTFVVADFPFSDPDLPFGDSLTAVEIRTTVGLGGLQLSGTTINAVDTILVSEFGSFTYTPVQNDYNNSGVYTTFTFRVLDKDNHISELPASTFEIFVTGNADDDAPITQNSEVFTEENVSYTFQLTDFPFDDPDIGLGDFISGVIINTDVGRGSLEFNSTVVTAPLTIAIADISDLVFYPETNTSGDNYTTFTFKVLDKDSHESNIATMVIDVGQTNIAPEARDTNLVVYEDTPYSFAIGDLPFTDREGDAIDSVEIRGFVATAVDGVLFFDQNNNLAQDLAGETSLVLNATTDVIGLQLAAVENLTFIPTLNEFGNYYRQFQFRVNDNNGDVNAWSNWRIVNIDVLSVNDLPESANDTITVMEDSLKLFNDGDFTFTDVEDGNVLSNIIIEGVSGNDSVFVSGTLFDVASHAGDTISPTDLSFRSVKDQFGESYATIQFRVIDSENGASATIYNLVIDVELVKDDYPTSGDTLKVFQEDISQQVSKDDFPFSDPDSPGSNVDFAELIVLTLPDASVGVLKDSNGDLVVAGDTVEDFGIKSLTFDPVDGIHGDSLTSFDFKVVDAEGHISLDSYTMTISINDVNNDPPVTADTLLTVVEDHELSLDQSVFVFIDSDNGASLGGVVIVNQTFVDAESGLFYDGVKVSNGDVINDLTKLVYIPAQDYFTENGNYEQITFKVLDDIGLESNEAVLSINVTPDNTDEPTGGDELLIVLEDTSEEINSLDIVNFKDVDKDTLRGLIIVSLPSNGDLYKDENGTITPIVIGDTLFFDQSLETYFYEPDTNKFGESLDVFQFNYLDSRNTVSENSFNMNITVNPVNDAPEAIVLNPNIVNENVTGVAIVGQLEVTDIDDTSFTYTIQPHDKFDIDYDGNVILKEGVSFDYEAVQIDSIIVTAIDGGTPGLTVTDTLVINIADIIETSIVTITDIEVGDSTWTNRDTIYISKKTVDVDYIIDPDVGDDVVSGDTVILTGENVFDSVYVIRDTDPTINSGGADSVVIKYNDTPVLVSIIWKGNVVNDSLVYHNDSTEITVTYIVTTPDKTGEQIQLSFEKTFDVKQGLNKDLTVDYTNIYGVTGTAKFDMDINVNPPEITLIDPIKKDDVKEVLQDVTWRIIPGTDSTNTFHDTIYVLTIDTLTKGPNDVTIVYTDIYGNTIEAKDKLIMGDGDGATRLIVPVVEINENTELSTNPNGKDISIHILNGDESDPSNNEYIFTNWEDIVTGGIDCSDALTGNHSDPAIQEYVDMLRRGDSLVLNDIDSTTLEIVLKEYKGGSYVYDDPAIINHLKTENNTKLSFYTSVNVPQLELNATSCNWRVDIRDYLEVYDQIGQFVNKYTIEVLGLSSSKFSIDGYIKYHVDLEIDPEHRSYLTFSGRKWGDGAYIIRHQVEVIATPINEDGSVMQGAKTVIQKLEKVHRAGYLRRD